MTLALALFLLSAAGGMALLVAGVHVLAGLGWSLIAAAVCLITCALFLRTGLRAPLPREVTGG